MAPREYSKKNQYNSVVKGSKGNLRERTFPLRLRSEMVMLRQTENHTDTSEAEKLIRSMRLKHAMNNAQRNFNDSSVAERNLPIKIQAIQATPLRHSEEEAATSSNSRILEQNRRMSVQEESIGESVSSKELEKASQDQSKSWERENYSLRSATGSRNNAIQDSNPVIPMEERHQARLVSEDVDIETITIEDSTDNERNSSELVFDSDEFEDYPTEPDVIPWPSVKEKSNNKKAGLSDIPENSKSMLRTDETKESDAEQSEKNKKGKKSSHPPSDKLKQQLRRSTRRRKSPIYYRSGRLQHSTAAKEKIKALSTDNKKKYPIVKLVRLNMENFKGIVARNKVTSTDGADKVQLNKIRMSNEFDRLKKESVTIKNSRKQNQSAEVAESNENSDNVNELETPPVPSDDEIYISDDSHSDPLCVIAMREPTADSGNQRGAGNHTRVFIT